MNPHKPDKITVYEHETLRVDRGEKKLTDDMLLKLQTYYGEKGVPYFSLVHNGVKFCEYVGVIQIGSLLIEILPKADKKEANEDNWRKVLISMLRAVGVFDIQAPSSSTLKLKSNSILELYFEIFLNQVEYLVHRGLTKKYRQTEGNVLALKGAIQVGKHLSHNLTHQERFYTKYTVYSLDHTLHQIIYQTLLLLKNINTNQSLNGKISNLLLFFPEVSICKISENTFDKIQFTRKDDGYRNAINIAKLLLLNFHPDVTSGKNDVLAIMFDMNLLWEKFVFVSLSKGLKANGYSVTAQTSKSFWQRSNGGKTSIRPDIVVSGTGKKVVLDTKWKNLSGYKPSSDDLRQMYVYHEYYNSSKVALLYPGTSSDSIHGIFLNPHDGKPGEMECSILPIAVILDINEWQKMIVRQFLDWFKTEEAA